MEYNRRVAVHKVKLFNVGEREYREFCKGVFCGPVTVMARKNSCLTQSVAWPGSRTDIP